MPLSTHLLSHKIFMTLLTKYLLKHSQNIHKIFMTLYAFLFVHMNIYKYVYLFVYELSVTMESTFIPKNIYEDLMTQKKGDTS